MESLQRYEIINYIETPRGCVIPIKIDQILELRMRAFMKARAVPTADDTE